MKSYVSILLIFSAFSLTNCKKTKLKNDYAPLVGEWRWIGGDDGLNASYFLDLKERGVYKLNKNNKQIESGQLLNTHGYLKFYSNRIFKNKNIFLHGRSIFKFKNDTMMVQIPGVVDGSISIFIKK